MQRQSVSAYLKMPLTIIPVFFFNDTATTEIYTLSLHDALPILIAAVKQHTRLPVAAYNVSGEYAMVKAAASAGALDRKSTRLNSSHSQISYAVFCLQKKNERDRPDVRPGRHDTGLPGRDHIDHA